VVVYRRTHRFFVCDLVCPLRLLRLLTHSLILQARERARVGSARLKVSLGVPLHAFLSVTQKETRERETGTRRGRGDSARSFETMSSKDLDQRLAEFEKRMDTNDPHQVKVR
jgi:hypothetical protein